jgi:hypothetical protein
MHANTTTAPATPATITITTQTPADLLSEAQMLVASAFRRADDEANDLLTWGDRDRICRSLNDALRLMREVREAITFTEPDPIASCLNCGAEEFADTLAAGGCQTCALLERISAEKDDAGDDDERTIICRECKGEEFADQSIRGECRMCAHYNALANTF